ncbi:MAG: glycine betaine ABC transporter substrate-binding protein [Halofilum sp. (in: g-proteobacteria)]|nr:glycine betaine ABC transporter substrate-binding protein [Halofilum sp. (in: g-proteobacteria)]
MPRTGIRSSSARRPRQAYDLETFSDLAAVAGELVLGGPPEMKTRATGLEGLKDVYGIEFAQFRPLDAGGPVTVGALENGDIDVARMFTTQGVIDARGWVVLEDDKELSPAQNVVPVARAEMLDDTIRGALERYLGEPRATGSAADESGGRGR